MGVSGSGKSTTGSLLANTLNCPFIEGDLFHSEENKRKMMSGLPLADSDRADWIKSISASVEERSEQLIILACSALTPFVQNTLRQSTSRCIYFCCLSAARKTLKERMENRNHFMPSRLLDSQIEDLSLPSDAKVFCAEQPVKKVVLVLSRYHCGIGAPSCMTWLNSDSQRL